MGDVVKDMRHATQMGSGEDGSEHLALSTMLTAFGGQEAGSE